MNPIMKMRSKVRSHFIPPLAFMQVLIFALLVFAAGGSYNLTVTEGTTPLPIFATTNGLYITNFLCINTSMTDSLTFTIAPTDTLTSENWKFGGATTPNTASGYSAVVTLKVPMPTNGLIPVTINSSRPNTDGGGGTCKSKQTVINLIPNNITRDGKLIYSTNNTVCVGQQINLTNLVSGVPASAITSYHWAVPGAAFTNYAPTAESAFCTNLQPQDLTNSYCNFYWSDGASNRVVYCTNVIYGHTNTVAATLNVSRPNAGIVATNAGTVGVDGNFYETEAPPYLHDGGQTAPPPTRYGMAFYETNSLPSGSSGSFGWLQIIRSDVEQTTLVISGSSGTSTTTSSGLDTTFPYQTGTNTEDSPDTPLLPTLPDETSEQFTRNFSATMYLIWQPTTNMIGSDNPVWVPLRGVDWNWSGTATNSGLGWGLQSSTNSNASLTNDFDVTNDVRVTNEVQWTSNAHPGP